MTEQRCLDCGTREAGGSYCTKCCGTNIDRYTPARSEAQRAATVHAGRKRAVASKETANPATVEGK